MTEPGTVSGTIAQSNNQGLPSNTTFASFTVSSSGGDAVPGSIPGGGVGFSNSGVVDSKEGTGDMLGEHDEVGGDEFGGEQVVMGKVLFSMDNLPEAPYYTYHSRELSGGKEQKDQPYYSSRSLGRGMNMDMIRSRTYWDSSESDLFTWDLSEQDPNMVKSEVEKNEDETVHDV